MTTSIANKEGHIVCSWFSSFMNHDQCLVNTVEAFLFIRIPDLVWALEENRVLLGRAKRLVVSLIAMF
ncbi:MAG: hypothetical protein ACLPX5_01045 [Dissulfurispiraceae bacterium]